MQSPVDEIKARLDIVDVIGTYTQLTRAGANFKARCPFHNEKTPSFMISRAKQLWYCFGACSEGGDMFKFLMKMEGIEFPEALKILADKAGIALPKYDKQIESKKNTLLDILKGATEFYAKELQGLRGTSARAYLLKRGLSEAIIKQFALGYAPDSWDALNTHMRDLCKAEDLFSAGLSIKRERDQGFYDRFRHRVMFPIRDIHGSTVGFTSRLLDEARKEGKYVNTPETQVYNKGRILYGLDMAREQIRKSDYALIVEGNMDVVACHQFGMTNVVAASGTAMTVDHVRLLKRYTNNLMICFDSDKAGENAAKRGIDIAIAEGMRVKVIIIPNGCGKDPDECVRKSIKAWEGAVRGAHEIMDYYIEKLRTQHDIRSSSGRTQFVNMLLREIIKFPDLIEQDFWLKRVVDVAQVDERLLREQMGKMSAGRGVRDAGIPKIDHDLQPTAQSAPVKTRIDLLSERIIALMLSAPTASGEVIGAILPEMLSHSHCQALYTKLTLCYTAYNSIRSSTTGPSTGVRGADFRQFWRDWLARASHASLSTTDPSRDKALEEKVNILELYGDKEFEGWEAAQFSRETLFLIGEIRRIYVTRRRDELAIAMRQAERDGNIAKISELIGEFGGLKDCEK